MSETVATKAAAEACGTAPRTLRVFLRASKDYESVGSGGRYAFTEDDLPGLKTRFDAWAKEREAAQAAREKAAKEKATTPAPGEADGDDDAEEMEDTEEEADEPEEKPAARRTRARKTTAAA